MALHFEADEFDTRYARLGKRMEGEGLDALLLFAQESMYWLTGYDTYGFSFFQCMIVMKDGKTVLLTRSADQRQARHTSTVKDIRIWVDRGEASPIGQLKDLLFELDLLGSKLGVEFDTHGMTGKTGREIDAALTSFADLKDVSLLVPQLRAIKSQAEIDYARKAAELADAAYEAGIAEMRPGADEGRILAAMQSAIFEGGGDFAGNDFVIGSGRDALLCRHKSGRRQLNRNDQVTLEFSGAYRHYHAALMRTVVVGEPTIRHRELFAVASEALGSVEERLRSGNTFGDIFDAYASTVDAHGMMPHRLNTCGYSLGARFAPREMDWPMAYRGNPAAVEPGMIVFVHMTLLDSATETAMNLGQTYLTGEGAPERLSRLPLDLPVKAG